jgi:hypothetical protein
LARGAGELAPEAGGQPLRPAEPQTAKNAKNKNIQVSPAVLDAAERAAKNYFRTCEPLPRAWRKPKLNGGRARRVRMRSPKKNHKAGPSGSSKSLAIRS